MYPYENLSLEDMPNEEWRDIKGLENRYQVSNLGRVKSLDRIVIYKNGIERFYKSQIKKQHFDRDKYLLVTIDKKQFKVHRLVALNFIDNPNNYPQVNHINCDKSYNVKDNLEWVTQEQNMFHAVEHGLSKICKYGNNNSAKKINQYDLKGNYIKTFDYIEEIFITYNNGIRNRKTKDFTSENSKPLFGYLWRLNSKKYPKYNPIKPYINKNLIIQFDKQGNKIREWNDYKDICDKYNIHCSSLYNCLNGRIKSLKGYVWKYYKDC